MRFPLLRRLSLLIHRRTRSEPFSGLALVEPLDAITRSFSMNNVGEQARPSGLDDLFPQIVLPPPHAIQTPPRSPTIVQSIGATSYPALAVPIGPYKLAAINQRILELEYQVNRLKADNERLRAANNTLTFDAELLQEQISYFEKAERPLQSDTRLITKEALNNLSTLARRCTEMDKFVKSLFDLGLQTEDPVFPRVHQAILAGETHDAAVIEAIRDAATKPSSCWSSLIPAVIGPRTNEQYLSALSMTLDSRKENKRLQSVKSFWKEIAKEDPANTDLITPSASTLSTIQLRLPDNRQRAVDDLLEKLRNGEIPLRGQVVSQVCPTGNEYVELDPMLPSTSSIAVTASAFPVPPVNVPSPICGSSSPAAPEPQEQFVTIEPSASGVSTSLPYLNSFAPSLPPLASQQFKQALIASHSSERFSLSKSQRRAGRDSHTATKESKTVVESVEEEEEKETSYVLPSFPQDFSDSSDLDIFGPSTSGSSGRCSSGSSQQVEHGSVENLKQEKSDVALDDEDLEGEYEIIDMSTISDITPSNDNQWRTKKSFLPVMKKHQRQRSAASQTPTKPPSLKRIPSRSATPTTPTTPSPTRSKFDNHSRPSTPSSLRKPTISSMHKTVTSPTRNPVTTTPPLRIVKKSTTRKQKRLSPMRRWSKMVSGAT